MAKKKKTQDDRELDLLVSSVRGLMSHKDFKRIIWAILEECGIYHDSFTGNSQTFYQEGKRAVGLFILQLLEDAGPQLYARLLLDHAKQIESRKDLNNGK